MSAKKLSSDIEHEIKSGSFHIKPWTFSGDRNSSEHFIIEKGIEANAESMTNSQRVLGILWNAEQDILYFKVKLNFNLKKRGMKIQPNLLKNEIEFIKTEQYTKRMILSQINSIYDPLGLITPFTIRSKMSMSKLW